MHNAMLFFVTLALWKYSYQFLSLSRARKPQTRDGHCSFSSSCILFTRCTVGGVAANVLNLQCSMQLFAGHNSLLCTALQLWGNWNAGISLSILVLEQCIRSGMWSRLSARYVKICRNVIPFIFRICPTLWSTWDRVFDIRSGLDARLLVVWADKSIVFRAKDGRSCQHRLPSDRLRGWVDRKVAVSLNYLRRWFNTVFPLSCCN